MKSEQAVLPNTCLEEEEEDSLLIRFCEGSHEASNYTMRIVFQVNK
jgi:hypothetical protein